MARLSELIGVADIYLIIQFLNITIALKLITMKYLYPIRFTESLDKTLHSVNFLDDGFAILDKNLNVLYSFLF